MLFWRDGIVMRDLDRRERGDVDLVAAGGAPVFFDAACELEGGFLSHGFCGRPGLRGHRGLGDDRLREPAAIAHDQELQLAAGALVMEPSIQTDFTPNVMAQVGDSNDPG